MPGNLARIFAALTLITLGACSSAPVTVTRSVYVSIPESLLARCRVPRWSDGTFRDLARLAVSRERALLDCNDQIEAVKAYQKAILAEN